MKGDTNGENMADKLWEENGVGALDPRSYTLVLLMPIGVSKQV
jgi:hypothetical protein